jgi:hypothetical protein
VTATAAAGRSLRSYLHDLGRDDSAFERHAWPPLPEDVAPSGSVVRLANLIEQSARSAGSLHYRLRPVLRDVARHRLQSSYGVDLDADPVGARRLLGARLFDLVRVDAPRPEDPRAPGLALDDLSEVLGRLESL